MSSLVPRLHPRLLIVSVAILAVILLGLALHGRTFSRAGNQVDPDATEKQAGC